MKKLLLFSLFIILIFCTSFLNIETKSFFCDANNLTHLSFLTTKPTDENFINAFPFYAVKGKNENAIGESFSFDNNNLIKENVLANLEARFVSKQSLDDLKIFYFFCPSIMKFDVKIVNGKKVNLQVAISNTKTTFGFPLILGSY